MANRENTNERPNLYTDAEWDQILPPPAKIEFDPACRRLTPEDKEALVKQFTGSTQYKVQTIVAGVLLSLLTLFFLTLLGGSLVIGDIIREDNFMIYGIILIILWLAITIVAFRLCARRMYHHVRKVEYRKQVMFIETQRDVLVYSATAIIPVKEIHVWEYVADHPEQVTYCVHNNTRLARGTKGGDLIYRYTNTLEATPKSASFFVSQTN